MPLIPKNRKDPLIVAQQEATLRLGAAHAAAQAEFPDPDPEAPALRSGTIAATRIGDVLVVSANGECAEDLEKLLYAAMLADPERV